MPSLYVNRYLYSSLRTNPLNQCPTPLDGTDPCVGICTRSTCQKVHDQDKVAICKRFLYKNNCYDGEDCPLSHTPTSHNTIACKHYRTGDCTNDDCRFPHIYVSPSAPVCEAFSRLGYCEKGPTCDDRHAFSECPDFTNKFTCEAGNSCPLIHVRHAGRFRVAHSSAEAELPLSATVKPPSVPYVPTDRAPGDKPHASGNAPMSTPTTGTGSNNESEYFDDDDQDASTYDHALSQQASFIPLE